MTYDLRANRLSFSAYWAPSASLDPPNDIDSEVLVSELEALLDDSVRLRMIADVPLVMQTFANLAPDVQAVIREHAIRSAQGMAQFVAMTENGRLQLSVYSAKGDAFSEVIVDHKTGKVAKSEPITGGEDVTAAKSQNEAMSKAKTSLQAAVSKAVKANKGYKAVSATPSLKDGHPTADITLMKGTESKTVSEQLD